MQGGPAAGESHSPGNMEESQTLEGRATDQRGDGEEHMSRGKGHETHEWCGNEVLKNGTPA